MKSENAQALKDYFFWFGAQNHVDHEGAILMGFGASVGINMCETPKLAADFLRATDPDMPSFTTMTLHNILFQFQGVQNASLVQLQDFAEFEGPSMAEMIPVLDATERWSDLDFDLFITPEAPLQ